MSDEFCEHVERGETKPIISITDKTTGQRRGVCRQCSADFVRSLGYDPQTYILGYNIYRSTDPKLPKNQWQKLNDHPLKEPSYLDRAETKPDLNADYYYYVTSVNAYGLESYPSKVLGPGETEWDIPDASAFEM